jgi:hypothetical protein
MLKAARRNSAASHRRSERNLKRRAKNGIIENSANSQKLSPNQIRSPDADLRFARRSDLCWKTSRDERRFGVKTDFSLIPRVRFYVKPQSLRFDSVQSSRPSLDDEFQNEWYFRHCAQLYQNLNDCFYRPYNEDDDSATALQRARFAMSFRRRARAGEIDRTLSSNSA